MSTNPNTLDALVASFASVRDDQLSGSVRSPRAAMLLATILDTSLDARQAAEARPPGAIESSSARWPRTRTVRRRGRLIALATAFALAVVVASTALGVVRGVSSFFAGWHDPEAPVPTAADVTIASGKAGGRWKIVATTSDRGLCLALVIPSEDAGMGGCGPTDVRGDPWAVAPRHWIGAFGAGGGSGTLKRTFAYGPLAQEVAHVDLVLSDGETMHAHVVRRPDGLDAPLNFYWATWPCGPVGCVDPEGPQVTMAIARDEAGHVLERRVPIWNGNPTGDPDGQPPPS